MKLHVYDHCPFCVRARMAFALKDIPFELKFQMSDDEETPISMIGQKMLPILEDEDGFMGESLDIVHKLDGLKGDKVFDGEANPALTDWIDRMVPTMRNLIFPRTVDPVFPEFTTESAGAYFTNKKETAFGSFAEHKANTATLVAEVEAAFADLIPLLPDPEGASINDILIFPWLRNLSMVEELTFPDPIAAYMTRMSELTHVPLIPDLRKA